MSKSDRSILSLNQFIEQRVEEANISCKSFIVTVFGDVIAPHGGVVWLGSLIDSLTPLGFSERLIRTSVFRLVKEDWLKVEKRGRKSFYAFTDAALKHYTKAARRIYGDHPTQTDTSLTQQQWLIVIPTNIPEEKLPRFKKQISWLGFSALTSGVYAHPSVDQASLEETLSELKIKNSVVVFSSNLFDLSSESALKELVQEKWNIRELQCGYQKLLNDYQPIAEQLRTITKPIALEAYLLRILLIHEYRRILLSDHELPSNMLPENWAGALANQRVKEIYAMLSDAACEYIVNQMQSLKRKLPPADLSYYSRFNNLIGTVKAN